MPTGFESPAVWRARGRGFQMGAVQQEGVTVHLTGQVAWDKHEVIVGRGDVARQTEQCFENMRALLAVVGGSLDDVVSITTYFTDRDQLPAIQRVRTAFLSADRAPVSTSVMVAGLGHIDFLVELTAVAVIPEAAFIPPGGESR